MRLFVFSYLVFLVCLYACQSEKNAPDQRPNIIWIYVEDMSANFGCYGENVIQTPHVDAMAENGILFSNAFSPAPVCSANRSAMMTGAMQTTFGVHQHRSSRGTVKISLPDSIQPIPHYFQNNGYFTVLTSYEYHPKSDYNFIWDPDMYDARKPIHKEGERLSPPWQKRNKNQPFFAQIQLKGGKNRHPEIDSPVDPNSVEIPPYYPQGPLYQKDWAEYLNSVINVDDQVGEIMDMLAESNDLENTVIFFFTDHGMDHYRHKQWLYDGGTHVPLIVLGAEKYADEPTQTRDDLVNLLDVVATSMDLAGIELPNHLEGQSLFAKDFSPRTHIITARDRCDWTVDRIRSVRTQDFKYIRNFFPHFSYMQSTYRDNWPIVTRARELYSSGQMNTTQAKYFSPDRPEEELYYLPDDPHEIHNLAAKPEFQQIKDSLSGILQNWIRETNDQGQYPESEESYEQAVINVNSSEFNQFPMVLKADPWNERSDTIRFSLQNTTQRPIGVKLRLSATGRPEEIQRDYQLKAEEIQELSLPVYESWKELKMAAVAVFPFLSESTGEFEYHLNFEKGDVYNISHSDQTVSIDGNLDDWDDLAYKLPLNQTESAEFDLFYNSDYVMIAVEVDDSDINVDPNTEPWLQDGIEVRFDARPSLSRGNAAGSHEFKDYLAVVMSPGKTKTPTRVYQSALGKRCCDSIFQQLQYAYRFTEKGHSAEVAIPLEYVENLQGKNWKSFRLNIFIHDKDQDGDQHLTWKPDWRNADNYVGSGTFYRK